MPVVKTKLTFCCSNYCNKLCFTYRHIGKKGIAALFYHIARFVSMGQFVYCSYVNWKNTHDTDIHTEKKVHVKRYNHTYSNTWQNFSTAKLRFSFSNFVSWFLMVYFLPEHYFIDSHTEYIGIEALRLINAKTHLYIVNWILKQNLMCKRYCF